MKNINNPFKGHVQDGSHFIFSDASQQAELIKLFEHFGYNMTDRAKEYDPKCDAYSIWKDGVALGKYCPECTGVFAIRYEEYHPYYQELVATNLIDNQKSVMVYKKQFAVKTVDQCFIADVYMDDASLCGSKLTQEAKKRLAAYANEEGIKFTLISIINGHSFTKKPQEGNVILRDPYDYEILWYFAKEYASSIYEVPVEWTAHGTVKAVGNNLEEAQEKVSKQIKSGTYTLNIDDSFEREVRLSNTSAQEKM